MHLSFQFLGAGGSSSKGKCKTVAHHPDKAQRNRNVIIHKQQFERTLLETHEGNEYSIVLIGNREPRESGGKRESQRVVVG